MAKLIHNNTTILDNMKYATSTFSISKGLMLSGRKKVDRGICLVMPSNKDVRYGASVTMLFCLHPLEILFVNSKFEIVDKVILKPWVPNYTPKKSCKYVIEAYPGRLNQIQIGDKVKIDNEFNI